MSQLGTEKDAVMRAEEEAKLLAPIRAHVGEIQAKIDALRKDGSDQVQKLKNRIQLLKEDKHIQKNKKDALIAEATAALSAAQAIESKNQAEVSGLVAEAESYLKEHYEKDYLGPVTENCRKDKENAKARYQARVAELGKEHEKELARLRAEGGADLQQELKDENYVYKNKLFDAKINYEQELQAIKDRRHEAFAEQYHMIDLLRMSRFTFGQAQAQRIENYKYTFNQRQFLLKNGLYIVIVMIFIALSIVTPILKNTQLFTYNNILNILQQASPRMFLALGVAGLILLTGTDLSIGRMTGMGMVAATIIMHKGVNTGAVFGKIFDFTSLPYVGRAVLALLTCIVLATFFTSVAGFFTARFKMHPFISTMSNMLIIFGLVTYATKGVSFGAIEPGIASMIVPKVNGFPLIIVWALAAILIVWFIWNKTRFGKNLFAIGGNPEAAAVSGVNVTLNLIGIYVLSGIFYAFGGMLEAGRIGSATNNLGFMYELDAIAACVIGGVSFSGGVGTVAGVVMGVIIFQLLNYGLSYIGVNPYWQYIIKGGIIVLAVAMDSMKNARRK